MLFGNGGADGYTLPYDQNPGYSNFSAGGFGFLFREAYDSYLTGNTYYYQTGGAQSWRYKYAAGANVLSLDGGNYRFNTVGSGSADAVASFTERFTILQAGNVGVGQAAPQHRLEVTGNICINSESTSTSDPAEIDKLIFQKQHADGSSGPYTLGEIRSYTTGGYSGGLKFYTGKSTGGGSYASTHAMTLDQNQIATFLGGKISLYNSTATLMLYQETDTDAYLILNEDNISASPNFWISNYAASTSGQQDRFAFLWNGEFHADSTVNASSSTTSSDIKLKENIEKIDNALDKVNKIDGVSFNWKKDGTEAMGVIAQNVEKVFPSAVKEVMTLGKSKEPKDTHLNVDYNQLVAVLIESVKEQQEIIEDLKKRIETLEK